MTNAMRLLAVAAIGVVMSLAGGGADARVHHHHHVVVTSTTTSVCGRHHRHCHVVATSTTRTQLACGRHHRHCRTVAVAPAAGGRMVCARHHRHCHVLVSRRYSSEAIARPAERTGDNGVCKSVRLHGEWVQQCNFAGQGQ